MKVLFTVFVFGKGLRGDAIRRRVDSRVLGMRTWSDHSGRMCEIYMGAF